VFSGQFGIIGSGNSAHTGETEMPETTTRFPNIQYAKPDIEQLQMWEEEGGCETPDGCWVEPDGICEHGQKSWLLIMGLI
jgi:hypothetical protein